MLMLAMTETAMTETAPAVHLWTPQGFRDDEWTHAETADALAGNGRCILPLAVARDLDPAQRASAKERLGVLVLPGDKIGDVVEILEDISLIALAFPIYNDGRSYSKATLLRERHGFSGALRATGQVLVDQLPHMLRLGFDEFEVTNPVLLARLKEGRLDGLPLYSQPAGKASVADQQYAWRRKPGKI